MTPDESEWLDGPGFVEWLHRNGLESESAYGETVARAIQRWKRGGKASIYAADELVYALGRVMSDIPEELYVETSGGAHGQLVISR